MSTTTIKNTTKTPLRIGTNKKNGKRLAADRYVGIPPRHVRVDDGRPGEVTIPTKVWDEMKEIKRIKERLGEGELVVVGG